MLLTNLSDDLYIYSDDPDKGEKRKAFKMARNTTWMKETMDQGRELTPAERDQCEYGRKAMQITAKCLRVNAENRDTFKKDQAYALCFANIYFMVKTGAANQLRTALEKRLAAMKSALSLADLDVAEFINHFIAFDEYKRTFETLSFFPKLKSVIFSNILSNSDDFNNHYKLILKESQFTVFNLIVSFVQQSEITLLHVQREVADEYEKFFWRMRLYETGMDRAGPFCKLVNPGESLGTLSHFPHLSTAARAAAFLKSPSLRNLKGTADVPAMFYQLAGRTISVDNVQGYVTADELRATLGRMRAEGSLDGITDALIAEARTADPRALPDHIDQFVRNPHRDE